MTLHTLAKEADVALAADARWHMGRNKDIRREILLICDLAQLDRRLPVILSPPPRRR